MNTDRKKYIIVFLITLGIFIVVFGLVNTLNNRKLASIDDLQRKITADLIATETQFDLLKTAPCSSVGNTTLSRELGEFGEKLSFAQDNQGADHPDVLQLKKYYSLLQVKDYLLMQELAGKCDLEIDSVLYFYKEACPDCTKQGYALTEFKIRYPELRVYSFDSDLDFSVIDTFVGLYDFGEVYPTMIVDGEVYNGFVGISELEELFPDLIQRQEEQENQQKAIEFILGMEEYQGLEAKDLSLESFEDGTYEFLLSIEASEEPTLVQVTLDENDSFMMMPLEEETLE